MGGRQSHPHDCSVSQSIGYFLEPLIVLGLFAKQPLTIRLNGITNDSKDPSVDTFKSTALPILKRFGVPSEGLDLKVESRGVPPNGGGEVILSLSVVQSLTAVNWTDEGFVKKIRGITFSAGVSAQFENSMIKAARGIINPLLSDVHIFSDHRSGPQAGNSPGYGISLVAETTSGCFISAGTAVSRARDEEISFLADDVKKGLMPPEDIGQGITNVLLGEIAQCGVVDSTYQGLLFLLCALCPQDVSRVRVGKLSPHGVETLRNMRDFVDLEVYYQTRSEDRVSFSQVYWLWHEESFSKGLLKHGRQLYIQHKSNELKFSNNCYIRHLEKNVAAASLYNTMPMRL